MSLFDRTFVIILVTLIAMAAVAMAFVPLPNPFGLTALPVFLILETLVYWLLLLVMNPRATLGMAWGGALVFVVLRAVCSLVGGWAGGLITDPGMELSLLVWIHPVPAVIQLVLLAFAGPYVLAATVPELVGSHEADRLLGGRVESARAATAATTPPGVQESTPSGGFIQVFSYEELAATIRKSPGLEGFVIVSGEGLIVWRDWPIRIDVEFLAAHTVRHSQDMGDLMLEAGLSRVRRMLIEGRDHTLFCTPISSNFSLILIFGGRVPAQDIFARIPVLAKTTREFLQWRYPSLGVRSHGPAREAGETVAAEMV